MRTLTKLAPTVAQSRDYADFAASCTVMTQQAGTSLGRRANADQLIADINAQLPRLVRRTPNGPGDYRCGRARQGR